MPGDDLFDLYEEHISKPAQEMQDMLLGTGLGSVPPGPPPSPEGPAGPTPVPPAPPGGAELLARLGTEAGPGGTLGTQVQG